MYLVYYYETYHTVCFHNFILDLTESYHVSISITVQNVFFNCMYIIMQKKNKLMHLFDMPSKIMY